MRVRPHFKWSHVCAAVVITAAVTAPTAATLTIHWQKSDVVPVVMVRPGIGGFVPVDGTSIGNTWSKDDVTPMCLVRPGITGFVPVDGSAIGNTWSKEDVKPFVEVLPSISGFAAKDRHEVAFVEPDGDVATERVVASKSYAGTGIAHWVRKVSNAGAVVELEDGSRWEIFSVHRIQTMLWLPAMNVSVNPVKKSIGEYKYFLKGADGEPVLAKLLGL